MVACDDILIVGSKLYHHSDLQLVFWLIVEGFVVRFLTLSKGKEAIA